MTVVSPIAQSDGHDAPRLVDEAVPSFAGGIEEVLAHSPQGHSALDPFIMVTNRDVERIVFGVWDEPGFGEDEVV